MVIATLQQYFGSLAYGLLVPRDTKKFREVSGRVEKIDESINIAPLVITAKPNCDCIGAASGQRSGLVSIKGNNFKIKGCGLEAALETEGVYAVNHGMEYNDPEGGITLSDAMRESMNTSRLNGTLNREGFQTCHEPAAIIHYGKMFKSPRMGREEELAAMVMKIRGDTRLPELYRRKVKNFGAAGEVTRRLGRIGGAQKRIMEDAGFLWSADSEAGNAHIGNYVIFVQDNYLCLCMCDFESMTNDLDELAPAEFLEARNKERQRLLASLMQSPFNLVDGIHRESEEENDRDIARQDTFRPKFVRGFVEGYEHPDKRELITLELLLEAFDFETG